MGRGWIAIRDGRNEDAPAALAAAIQAEHARADARNKSCNRAASLPTWLNEGLAVMFEPDGSRWAQSTLEASSARIPLIGGLDPAR